MVPSVPYMGISAPERKEIPTSEDIFFRDAVEDPVRIELTSTD